MATSTIPAFGDALKAALEALPALAGTPVTDGLPPPGVYDGPEWVALMDVDFEQSRSGFGTSGLVRNEEYTQNVLISVRQATRADQTTGVERAFEIFAALESLLHTDPKLASAYTGAGQILDTVVQNGELTRRTNEAGDTREANIQADVFVRALIQ